MKNLFFFLCMCLFFNVNAMHSVYSDGLREEQKTAIAAKKADMNLAQLEQWIKPLDGIKEKDVFSLIDEARVDDVCSLSQPLDCADKKVKSAVGLSTRSFLSRFGVVWTSKVRPLLIKVRNTPSTPAEKKTTIDSWLHRLEPYTFSGM